MKKHGFTLAEVLISLGIVAVVAALTAPSLINLMPDKNKAKVVKLYSTLNSINRELLSNPAIYPGEDAKAFLNDEEYPCKGFECTERPLLDEYREDTSTYWGWNKYPNLLRSKLEISEGAEPEDKTGEHTFTTIDGVKWTVDFGWNSDGGTFITFDLDSSDDSSDCKYGDADCKKPDQFQFHLDESGKLTPNDALTYFYIKNQGMNNKKKDLEDAKKGAPITFKKRNAGPGITLW